MRILNSIFVLLGVLAASIASAGELSLDHKTISAIKAGDGQVAIYLTQNFTNTACGGESRNSLLLLASDPDFAAKYAAVLSAIASGKTIGVWTNECRDSVWGAGWPNAVVIYVFSGA